LKKPLPSAAYFSDLRRLRSAADALGTVEELKDQDVGLHVINLGGDVCGNDEVVTLDDDVRYCEKRTQR